MRLTRFREIRIGEKTEICGVALQLLELCLSPSGAKGGYRFGQPHGIRLHTQHVGRTLDNDKAAGF